MGLDITAYRKLEKLECNLNGDGEPIDPSTGEPLYEYFKCFANDYFPGREQGLESGACYKYEMAANVFSRAYSSYNHWREELAKLAGYPLTNFEQLGIVQTSHAAAAWLGKVKDSEPFCELVNFTDCDGVIGPVVARKLLADFISFDEKAKAVDSHNFYKHYTDIRRGLEMAADGGALQFH